MCIRDRKYPAVPCYLEEWVKDTKHQQFFYDIESGVIKDGAHGFELCSENGQLSLCNFAGFDESTGSSSFTKYHTKWRYDGVTQTLKHLTDFGSTFPYVQKTAKWSQIFMDANQHQDSYPMLNINAKYRNEYCYKDK